MNYRWIAAALLAASTGTLGAMSTAQAQDAASVRQWASTCATCHGTDGRSVGGVPPALAGRPKAELTQALLDFKSGKRPEIGRAHV